MTSRLSLSAHTFFLDRNFGRYKVAVAMRSAGFNVETHYDHFPDAENGEVDDSIWIRQVTERGWVILTRDERIRRNPLERATFMACGARVFNIRRCDVGAEEIAQCIQLASKRIARELATRTPPYMIGISLGGNLTYIDPAAKKPRESSG